LTKRAWEEFLRNSNISQNDKYPTEPVKVNDLSVLTDLMEIPAVTTNHYSQWFLNAIELLELVGDYIPEI
jgi:hypothetical protein